MHFWGSAVCFLMPNSLKHLKLTYILNSLFLPDIKYSRDESSMALSWILTPLVVTGWRLVSVPVERGAALLWTELCLRWAWLWAPQFSPWRVFKGTAWSLNVCAAAAVSWRHSLTWISGTKAGSGGGGLHWKYSKHLPTQRGREDGCEVLAFRGSGEMTSWVRSHRTEPRAVPSWVVFASTWKVFQALTPAWHNTGWYTHWADIYWPPCQCGGV